MCLRLILLSRDYIQEARLFSVFVCFVFMKIGLKKPGSQNIFELRNKECIETNIHTENHKLLELLLLQQFWRNALKMMINILPLKFMPSMSMLKTHVF